MSGRRTGLPGRGLCAVACGVAALAAGGAEASAQGAASDATRAAVRGGARSAAAVADPPYQRLIERVAERHEIDPYLFGALVEVESGRRAEAISPKGARGLGQLMPATARRFGVDDPHDPEANLEGAARYLSFLLARYEGDLRLALAAYNAGEAAVDRFGGIPDYPETHAYVRKVLDRAGLRQRTRGTPPGAPDPVRVVARRDGTLLLTNVPK